VTLAAADIPAHALFVDYRAADGRAFEPEIVPRPDGDVYVCGMADPARAFGTDLPHVEGALEELLIGLPPERVVDDNGPEQGGALEVCAVVGDLVRDPVDNQAVIGSPLMCGPSQFAEIRRDLSLPLGIHPVDKGLWKGVLASNQEPDLHNVATSAVRSGSRPYLESYRSHCDELRPVSRGRAPGTQRS